MICSNLEVDGIDGSSLAMGFDTAPVKLDKATVTEDITFALTSLVGRATTVESEATIREGMIGCYGVGYVRLNEKWRILPALTCHRSLGAIKSDEDLRR